MICAVLLGLSQSTPIEPDRLPVGLRIARITQAFRSSLSLDFNEKIAPELGLPIGLPTFESFEFSFAKAALSTGRLTAEGKMPPLPRTLFAVRLEAVNAEATIISDQKSLQALPISMTPLHASVIPAKQGLAFRLGVAGLSLPPNTGRLDVTFLTSGYVFEREFTFADGAQIAVQLGLDANENMLALTAKSLTKLDGKTGRSEVLAEGENYSGFAQFAEAGLRLHDGQDDFSDLKGETPLKLDRTGLLTLPLRQDQGGNLYSASQDRLALESFEPDGKLRWRAAVPHPIVSFDTDDKGNAFVLSRDRAASIIYRLEPQTRVPKPWLSFAQDTFASYPQATMIRWLPQSRLIFVGDAVRGEFGLFSPEAAFVRAAKSVNEATFRHLVDVTENKRGDLLILANSNDERKKAVKILRQIK